MIKIGIELSMRNLRYDLLENPGRYFFIREADSGTTLCIQTCDFQGEDIKTHIIDGLFLNKEGKLNSIFEDGINDAILEWQDRRMHSSQEDGYPISSHLVRTLSRMPDLMDWIISSVLTRDRNLVIYPSWSD